MTTDVSEMRKADEESGWRAALVVKLAMLGVAILVVQASITGRNGGLDMTNADVSPIMLTLVRGI
jgi:hypothetical protein